MDEEFDKYKKNIDSITLHNMDEYAYQGDIRKLYEIVDEIINKELECAKNGDYDKAKDYVSLYNVIYSKFSDRNDSWGQQSKEELKVYINKKVAETHRAIMTKKFQEYDNLPPEASKQMLSEFVEFCKVWNIDETTEIRDNAIQSLKRKVDERVAGLDIELQNAKEHIEFPENEKKYEELQSEIEELEGEMSKVVSYGKGTPLSFEQRQEIEGINKHRIARIQEQGPDISQIMTEIGEYNGYGKDTLEQHVAKKTQFLERKSAYLQKYKDIPGNKERIAEIERQIETMQDAYTVKTLDLETRSTINRNNKRIGEKRERLVEIEAALNNSGMYSETRLQELRRSKLFIEQLISNLEQENTLLSIGEHHKNRLEQEASARAEKVARVEQEPKVRKEPSIVTDSHNITPTENILIHRTTQTYEQQITGTTENYIQQPVRTPEVYEQQLGKAKPKGESIRNEIGDEIQDSKGQLQERTNPSIDLWMNRFNNWYSVVDRISQNVKTKFLKMKSDIIKAISDKVRGKDQAVNKNQEDKEDIE